MDYFNLIHNACEYLLEEFGATTTLDIKNYLIENVPTDKEGNTIIWRQKFVSAIMEHIHENEVIDNIAFTDNGTYRTYYIEKESDIEYMTRTDMVSELKDHKGRFITTRWITNKGNERTYSIKIQNPFMDNLGYIRVKTSKGKIKSINPKGLLEIRKSSRIIMHKSLKQ